MSAQVLFYIYAGFAFAVALVSFLWGSQQKILGAALLLGSIVLSNIILLVFGYLFPNIRDLTLLYVAMDLTLAFVFVHLFADKTWLRRNRWAGFLAAIHIVMTAVNLAGALNPEFGRSGRHGAMLNGLVIAAMIVCLVGFTPKSLDEARGVLKMKWTYLIHDILGRVRALGSEAALVRKQNQTAWIDEYIGGRIRELRKSRGLNQYELADLLDISQAHVNRIEKGQNRTTATQLFTLTRIFGVDMNYFTEGAAKPAAAAAKPAKS